MIIGIDPGKKGALCILDKVPKFVDFKDKNILGYIEVLKDLDIKLAAIEKVGAMRGQGVVSMFSFGENYGMIQGVLKTLGIPYILVRPQEWQKTLNIPTKSDKKVIASIIQNIYPNAELYGIRGGLNDGRSDSLCIAHYAQLYNKGKTI